MSAEHGPAPLLLGSGSEAADHYRLLATGHEASKILEQAGIRHLAGGGIAVWAYGRRRMTKDIDLFLEHGRQFAAMDILARRGFHTRDTDANWLYKAIRDGVVIDLITFTTGDIRLDAGTFKYLRRQAVDGFEFPLMGPEDVVFRKIYSADETRFHDWYDALAIVARRGRGDFDWDYFARLGSTRVLNRVVSFLFFALSDPAAAENVPPGLLQALVRATGVCSSSNTT
ncbi:MAG: nucleotidyltransferase [Candidatus Sericytochromatia bacterium]|nr:nucleotidyltransferase [Candidatus Tanganyikabacteria bacterium]